MEEAHQHPTLAAYSASLTGQPDLAFPLHHIPHQVAEAVRAAMNGQPRDVVQRAVRAHVRDAAFLIYLVLGANGHVLGERRLHWMHLCFVTERQRPALKGWERWDVDQVHAWNERMANLAYEIFRLRSALDVLAERYLAGTSPLFPATAAELAEQCQHVEQLIWCSNEGLVLGVFGPKKQKVRESLRLSIDRLTALGQDGAQPLVTYLVHMAKAEALMMLGERDQAYGLVERHV